MRFALLLFLILGMPGYCFGGLVFSTFDSGLDGWTHAAGGDPGSAISYVSSGGNPGGFARIIEPAVGSRDWFAAPTKFLGDKSVYYGGTLSYDLRRSETGLPPLVDQDVLLIGAGLEISIDDPIFASTTEFTNFNFELIETAGWTLAGGGAPTKAQFQSILQDLTDFQIIADWTNGQDTSSLDNVALAAVPEPSGFLLLFSALTAACVRRSRRTTA